MMATVEKCSTRFAAVGQVSWEYIGTELRIYVYGQDQRIVLSPDEAREMWSDLMVCARGDA